MFRVFRRRLHRPPQGRALGRMIGCALFVDMSTGDPRPLLSFSLYLPQISPYRLYQCLHPYFYTTYISTGVWGGVSCLCSRLSLFIIFLIRRRSHATHAPATYVPLLCRTRPGPGLGREWPEFTNPGQIWPDSSQAWHEVGPDLDTAWTEAGQCVCSPKSVANVASIDQTVARM